ncbi:MAG: 3-isopropylmalate dehydratase small subunit [Puniceicoccaceae bacterium]
MAIETIKQVRGRGVTVPGDDIDTDRIIPARFMKCVTFDGLGEYAFYDVRFAEDGTLHNHPLNDTRFKDATILISGSNFGCGSSREHAPQSLCRYGFRAVIAESFAEIFFGNSTTLGMPCVTLRPEDRQMLSQVLLSDPDLEIVIDLEARVVRAGEMDFACEIAESAREALVSGKYDPIADLLEGLPDIDRVAAGLPYMNS